MLETFAFAIIISTQVLQVYLIDKLNKELNIVKGQLYDLAARVTHIETVKEAIGC